MWIDWSSLSEKALNPIRVTLFGMPTAINLLSANAAGPISATLSGIVMNPNRLTDCRYNSCLLAQSFKNWFFFCENTKRFDSPPGQKTRSHSMLPFPHIRSSKLVLRCFPVCADQKKRKDRSGMRIAHSQGYLQEASNPTLSKDQVFEIAI